MIKSVFIYLFIGGGIGASLRYLITYFAQKCSSITFLGVLLSNILGCFLIGFLLQQNFMKNTYQHHFWITGLLGALTTFSSFSYQSLQLIILNMYEKALWNIFLNNILGLTSALIGYWLGHKIGILIEKTTFLN